ncbi:MAG TPA: L,D-transpeptidase [Acidimicrobiales bacterium]|nr:L,D-transpeptidase [Acidimicrobiales bacterium]
MKRAAPKHSLGPRQTKRHYVWSAAITVALAAALIAIGGLPSSGSNPEDHLLAMGPRVIGGPPAGPVVTVPTSTTTRPVTPPGTTVASKVIARVPKVTRTARKPTVPALPRLLSISPRNRLHNVAPKTPIVIRLSAPPRHGAPMPVLAPAVPGRWRLDGDTLSFTPLIGYGAWSTQSVTVPAALARTASPKSFVTSQFNVQGVGTPRAEQLLAELKYIPLRFGTTPLSSSLPQEPRAPGLVSPLPEQGMFTWRYPNIPAALAASWSPTQYNVILEGAIMTFEDQHNLAVDGLMGPQVWQALARAVALRQVDPAPYDYLMVSELLPEKLFVWRNGATVYQTYVNTGVDGANTPVGTWPVYLRFVTTTMVGTDVDGARYDVPDVPWVAYFNGGDAVHGYWRYSYGYPQSNGCVELPITNAQAVWAMDPIGTLVNVSD